LFETLHCRKTSLDLFPLIESRLTIVLKLAVMIAIIVISSFAILGVAALIHAIKHAPLIEEKRHSNTGSKA